MGWLAGKDAGIYVGWLGLDEDFTTFPGFGPDGVATFALDLQDGFTVTLSWDSPIVSHADGTEERSANLDRPVQHYDGAALLLGNARRLTRARLARYAAQGAEFLLALPHEALTLIADASGTILTVSSLAYCDWQQPGQRVVVLKADRSSSVDGVIQSVSGNQMTLDIAPGDIGDEGGKVMPAMAVFLEPQQEFNRYKTAVESWSLSARAAIFDFAPASATLDLGTFNPGWAGFEMVSTIPGLSSVAFTINASATNPAGGTIVTESYGALTAFAVKGGTDTLETFAALVNSSSINFKVCGTYAGSTVIGTGDGTSGVGLFVTGGSASGAMGTGATLTMYDGHPVWHPGVENRETISEPVNAMTSIIDMGGVPLAFGRTKAPAWGRAVAFTGSPFGGDWAWLQLMLASLRGAQGMFWLPTWNDDITPVSLSGDELVVRTDDESDIAALYPSQRDRIQIQYADGSVDYRQITAMADHGDGTQTLTLDTVASGSDITKVSWLEPCRFEGSTFQVKFTSGSFSMQAPARAHSADDPDVGEAL